MSALSDTRILNWLENEADDISITRDLGRGKRVKISYCSPESGCPVEKTGPTLRGVVESVMPKEIRFQPGDRVKVIPGAGRPSSLGIGTVRHHEGPRVVVDFDIPTMGPTYRNLTPKVLKLVEAKPDVKS